MNGNEACETGSQAIAGAHVGIDVSKLKLDVARLRAGKVRNKVFSNDRVSFKALAAWLGEDGVVASQAHLCMEATGPYSEALAVWLSDEGWSVSGQSSKGEGFRPKRADTQQNRRSRRCATGTLLRRTHA